RIGVDHDLVREALLAAPVRALVADEFLAVRPVRIADWPPAARIRVEHLLRRDDLYLIRVSIEAEFRGGGGNCAVVALDQLEAPVRAFRQQAAHRLCSLLNRLRNTG